MMPGSPEQGLYLHIPFCRARCGYCDFVTFTGQEDRIGAYVKDLGKEIQLYAAQRPQRERLSTVFFGGGTPSLLEPLQVDRLLERVRAHYDLAPDAEITLEANPESLTLGKAQGWRNVGVNRLSIGLQAFDNALLRAMDRLHTVEDFQSAFEAARSAGFENINVDLIYGFPRQTMAGWQETLMKTIRLEPEHLSLYALKIENHTPFLARGAKVDDDLQADMDEWARPYLNRSGYPQYEISNYAKPGKACRHNLLYWRQENYIGLGVGAVGCVDGLRWENHKDLAGYSKAIAAGQFPRASSEELSENTKRFERIMLGLRLREGLFWEEEPDARWQTERQGLAARHLLEKLPSGRWRIPDSAVPFTNQVLLAFL